MTKQFTRLGDANANNMLVTDPATNKAVGVTSGTQDICYLMGTGNATAQQAHTDEHNAMGLGGVVRSLGRSGVLMLLPSSGSVGGNGAVTGLTALPAALGACYAYFPAGALYAGSVAGFYYCDVTSTTAATAYNDRWTGGTPVFPATPTPIVATGPGAYTQTTGAAITAASVVIPGGTLGTDGVVTVYPNIGANNTGNNKAWAVRFAGNSLISKVNTTATIDNTPVWLRAGGTTDRQIATSYAGLSTNAGAVFARVAVDSTVAQDLIITLQLATATDYMFLQGFDVTSHF
jgi:hypothetical protein